MVCKYIALIVSGAVVVVSENENRSSRHPVELHGYRQLLIGLFFASSLISPTTAAACRP